MVTRTHPREHDILAHTADMGVRAAAADLAGVFEEAAVALGEIGADLEPGMDPRPGAGGAPVRAERQIAAEVWAASAERTMAEDRAAADERAAPDEPVAVRERAHDLVGLAFEWLNDLIGLADAAHAAIARTRVERIERSTPEADWELEAHVWLRPFGGGGARPRLGVKSATLHRLAVEREPDGWSLVAYLDV